MIPKTLALLVAIPALALADGHGETKAGPTADQAIQSLKDGNARFVAVRPAIRIRASRA